MFKESMVSIRIYQSIQLNVKKPHEKKNCLVELIKPYLRYLDKLKVSNKPRVRHFGTLFLCFMVSEGISVFQHICQNYNRKCMVIGNHGPFLRLILASL